ncbi:MAG: hypothetical protein OEY89_15975 [Gammaproteobacteria bacterium]|nr:hypothetical protein [Gammaproteobacteria bacterium]
MADKNYSYLINVEEDFREGEYWVLTSKQLPGLFLSGKDLKTLRADVPNVIKTLYRLNYEMDVDVRLVCEETPATKKKPAVCGHAAKHWSANPIHAAA